METFAYLQTACAYEDPEATQLTLSLDQLDVTRLSGQVSLLMLQLLVPAAILAMAGHASALQVGDRGPSVTTLQNRLRAAGYFNRSSTGVYSTITEAAVRKFQASRGLVVDGIAGPATQQALRGQSYAVSGGNYQPISYSSGLRLGSTGAEVRTLQQRLRDLGYDVAVDGIFGSATDRAVRQFQGSNGLATDGIVGSATRNTLYNGTNTGYSYPPLASGYPSGGSGGYFPPVVSANRKQYVVVVPIKSSATLSQVQQVSRNRAFIASSNLGKYVNAGAFDERGLAEAEATRLRTYKFDAQVRYF